jgi:3-phosphoglycerate kinase
MIRWIDDPSLELKSKRVFCRVDFNVPLTENGEIIDDSRIKAVLPTIQYLLEKEAKVILASHLGRPKGKPRRALSLEPVAIRLNQLLSREIIFIEDCVGDGVKQLSMDLPDRGILLLENLRFHSGEEKNDESFAKMLAQNIDIYVDDAFGVVHRAHASTEGMTHFVETCLGGLLLRKEIEALYGICRAPKKPFLAILGGAKVSDKIGVISHLLSHVDKIIIGGAMAYTFLRAQGKTIGASLFEEDKLLIAKSILHKAKEAGVQIILPVDHIAMRTLGEHAKTFVVSGDLTGGEIGVDIGPKSQKLFTETIADHKTIFWNGPLGICEWPSCSSGTHAVVDSICKSKGFTVAGGGDSIAVLKALNKTHEMSHVSTGGGASLELIEGSKLSGLVALGYSF